MQKEKKYWKAEDLNSALLSKKRSSRTVREFVFLICIPSIPTDLILILNNSFTVHVISLFTFDDLTWMFHSEEAKTKAKSVTSERTSCSL